MKEMDYVIIINDYSETFNDCLFIVIHNGMALGLNVGNGSCDYDQ